MYLYQLIFIIVRECTSDTQHAVKHVFVTPSYVRKALSDQFSM